jgi:hypothetical protein
MPIEPVVFGGKSGSVPQRRLALFVGQVGGLLQAAVFEEGEKLFYSELLPEMRDAWPSVSNRFGTYTVQVSDASTQTLQEHGLTEKELDFKFAAINFIARRFYQSLGGALQPMRDWFSKLLEIIDKLLRSLVAAVPGGGAIEEYKDICESLIPTGE